MTTDMRGRRAKRSIWVRTAWLASLLAAFSFASPAAAQFEIIYPDEPAKEGQTLLEWSRPPVLEYTIPDHKRGDVSTCDAASEFDLDQTALTCWPVLRASQFLTLASFAQGEPTGDPAANQRAGIAYANQGLEFIGTPRWPLQEFLRTKLLEVRLLAEIKLEQWERALATSADLIASIESDAIKHDDFRLGYAQRKRGDILLKLDQPSQARKELEEARPLLLGPEGVNFALPFSDFSENVIADAIRRGDTGYAASTIESYLNHIKTVPAGLRMGITAHHDLQLYLLATRGDLEKTLAVLRERARYQASSSPCSPFDRLFPAVLAPLRDNEELQTLLKEIGCEQRALDKMEEAATEGIKDYDDSLLLPRHEGTAQ